MRHYRDGAQTVKLHGEVSAVSRLWNLIEGNKLSNGGIEWDMAAMMARQVPQAVENAAKEHLEILARSWVRQQGLPGDENSPMPNARAQVRRMNPGIASMMDSGANVTAKALREMFLKAK